MTEQQLNVIVGLVAGMQTALVHLSNVVARHGGISPEELAGSFEATAEAVPAETLNRALIQMALQQIASGVRSSNAGPEFETLMRKLLH